MSDFFSRPAPQQAVPGDLTGGRQQILDALFGPNGGNSPSAAPTWSPYGANRTRGGAWTGSISGGANGTSGANSALGQLLGLTGANGGTPGGDVLGPLRAASDQRLNDQISQLNSQGGRFSTGNLFGNMDLRARSQNDFNLLGAQVLEHGRDRQLQSILALLGPVLGPTFGGPFTQGSSGFDNLLGLINSASGFIPGTGARGGTGGGSLGGPTSFGSGGYGYGT